MLRKPLTRPGRWQSKTTVPDEAGETKCFPGALFKKVTNTLRSRLDSYSRSSEFFPSKIEETYTFMNICWTEISRDLKISSKCSVKAMKNTTLCKLPAAASSPGSSRFHQAPDIQVKFHGRRWACGISNINMTFWNDLCNLKKRRCPKGYHTHPNFDLPDPA